MTLCQDRRATPQQQQASNEGLVQSAFLTCSKKAASPLRQVSLQAGGCHISLLRQLPVLQPCMQLPSRKMRPRMLRVLRSDGADYLQSACSVALSLAFCSLRWAAWDYCKVL